MRYVLRFALLAVVAISMSACGLVRNIRSDHSRRVQWTAPQSASVQVHPVTVLKFPIARAVHPISFVHPAPLIQIHPSALDIKVQLPALRLPLYPSIPTNDRLSVSSSSAEQCLAMTIYREARGEGTRGMAAVGYVVMNRVKHKYFPGTVCEVVLQARTFRSGRRVCQFSWVCGKAAKRINRKAYLHSLQVARAVLNKSAANPVGCAIFFHRARHIVRAPRSSPYYLTLGHHRFFGPRPLKPINELASTVRPIPRIDSTLPISSHNQSRG